MVAPSANQLVDLFDGGATREKKSFSNFFVRVSAQTVTPIIYPRLKIESGIPKQKIANHRSKPSDVETDEMEEEQQPNRRERTDSFDNLCVSKKKPLTRKETVREQSQSPGATIDCNERVQE